MERQFKHKKTGEIAYYKDGVFKQGRFCVEIGVEPSSEFWEEVIERDYEILSFRSKNLSFYQPRIQKDSTYLDCLINSQKGNGATLEWMLNEPEYYIESVKRLSDGEVFTIGDKYIYKLGDGTVEKIEGIVIRQNKIWLQKDLNNPTYGVTLEYAEKEPKVLFTTLDNFELRYGDKFYVVDTKFFKIFEAEAGITFKTEKWIKNSYFDKKLAEEYILMHEPVLSLKDLLSVWSTDNLYDVYKESPMFQNFKKLAESKIKGDE